MGDAESSARPQGRQDLAEVCEFLGPGLARGLGAHEARALAQGSPSLLGHPRAWPAHEDDRPPPRPRRWCPHEEEVTGLRLLGFESKPSVCTAVASGARVEE